MTTADTLKHAIENQQCLSGSYDGYPREFCPHLLGWKGRTQMVLVHQFGGSSKSGLPPEGAWRCMRVDGLGDITPMDVQWRTGEEGSRRPSCVDAGQVEAIAEGYNPGGHF
jgi:hypothetical protein